MSESERRTSCSTDTQHMINLSGYFWAQKSIGPSVSGKVLDIASGTGYGADFLAGHAALVIGSDDDFPALKESKNNYVRRNLVFVQSHGEQLPFKTGTFRAVVSLETVEHVPDDSGFMSEIHRILMPGGVLALTTPYQEEHCNRPQNPHHLREYSARSLTKLIETHFDIIKVLGRHPGKAMSASEDRMDDLRRYDYLSLRSILPRFLRHRIADAWLKIFGEATLTELRPEDVHYTPELSGAISLAVLARKRI